jgi:iron complex outermembrane receptor protein
MENRVSLGQGGLRLVLTAGVGETLDLETSASYFTGRPTSRDRIEVGSDIFFVRRRFGYAAGESQVMATWRLNPHLTLVAGCGATLDDEDLLTVEHVLKASPARQQNGGAAVTAQGGTGGADKRLVNPGAFAQAIWKPLGTLLGITAGMRYDWHTIYGHELSGRIALVSSPWERLHLKLLAGNAFKAPTPLQLYAVPFAAGDVIGNADLEAQHVATVEGQIIYEVRETLTASLGTTYSLITDKAEFTPKGVNQVADNVAEVGSLSFEAELTARYRDRVTGYVNAALNHTVNDTGEEGYRANLIGHANTLYPTLIVNSGVRGVLPRLPIEGGFELSYVSPRRASNDNLLENVGDYSLPAYWLAGATLALVGDFLVDERSTRLMIIGRNLFDSIGPDPGFGGIDYPLLGRALMLQWTQEL